MSEESPIGMFDMEVALIADAAISRMTVSGFHA